jgi:hypothetical protein
VYLADFSAATDVSSLYPNPANASSPDYLYFDSTTFSECLCGAGNEVGAVCVCVCVCVLQPVYLHRKRQHRCAGALAGSRASC